jgi:hypothetical protein
MSRALSANGRLAAASRPGRADRDRIAQLRRELTEAKIHDYIEKLLDTAPPLTQEQRTRLAELLKPVRVNGCGGDEST